MKKKIIGIFVCMMLITTVFPVVGNTDKSGNPKIDIFESSTYDEYVPGEFIIKFSEESAISNPSFIALNEINQVKSIERVFVNAENTILDHIYVLKVPETADIFSIVSDYDLLPKVAYAEPNFILHLPVIPNDEYFEDQWALNNSGQLGGSPDADIDAVEAWDIETGSTDIIIASVDTGVEYTHSDLEDNIWVNPGEDLNGNGAMDQSDFNEIDDDENGYIDDIIGWDFVDNDNDPIDTYFHGTICAGVHCMVSNNEIGGAGICWECKTLIAQFSKSHSGQVIWCVNAIKYAADNGADVINIEGYQYEYSSLLKDGVDYAYEKGCFLVAPAGNDNTNDNTYPASLENVLSVSATNQRDERCDEDDWGEGSGSNYGDWVDVAAPGHKIFTTNTNNKFTSFGGTSLASPHAAGLAALLLSADPSLTQNELKEIICDENNVDPYISDEYIGTGRINAHKCLLPYIEPVISCEGSLGWMEVKPGVTVTGSFTVENIGDLGSSLSWEIYKHPEWGEWAFEPESGTDLYPEDGTVTIKATCIVKDMKNRNYTGTIRVKNTENNQYCEVPVYCSVPKIKFYTLVSNFISWIFQSFPNAFSILKYLMGQ